VFHQIRITRASPAAQIMLLPRSCDHSKLYLAKILAQNSFSIKPCSKLFWVVPLQLSICLL